MELLIFSVLALGICTAFIFVAMRPTRPLADESEKTIGEILKFTPSLLADVAAMRAELRTEFAEVKQRLSFLEAAVAAERKAGSADASDSNG